MTPKTSGEGAIGPAPCGPRARLARHLPSIVQRGLRRPDDGAAARDPHHDWYAESCPCGLPPGDCREHPRARPNQQPPDGDWRTWLLLAGRGFGKTRTGAEWVWWLVRERKARRIALVAPTAADARDVMVEGESGLLTICPEPKPIYEPSKRRLTWEEYGAIATTYSAEEPNRLRGPQHDAAWCDEIAAWERPQTWDNLLFGLRLGERPRVCVTTTPKPTKLVKSLVAEPTTAPVKGTTYDNRAHLAPSFFDQVVAVYEGTRLGQQEIHAEILETSDGAWFAAFDPTKHVTADAEYDARYPVHLAIDAGVSRHTAAVWFQSRQVAEHRWKVTVFADYYAVDRTSEANARAIQARSLELPSRGRIDTVRLDPAASARTGIGPAAYGEYERIFGGRALARWPGHRVADGLDQLELLLETGCLLIHPRCAHLKAAFQNYVRKQSTAGEWLDDPVDPQHPSEDLMDALRGGVRDRFPEGRVGPPRLKHVHARGLV